MTISDDTLDKTLNWLSESAKTAAQARANRCYMEEFRKSLKALLMARSGLPTAAAQEVYAYAHEDYQAHLVALKDAVEKDEAFRWRLTTAEARIEVWRSEQATRRAQEKVQ